MIRCEDLCQSCLHFDRGDYECKAGQYLEESINQMFTYECEDYEPEGEDAK